MKCPRCFKTDVSPVGDTHYVCNNIECVDEHGNRTQFCVKQDDRVRFPYNQIFVGRDPKLFYRKPYWVVTDVGLVQT